MTIMPASRRASEARRGWKIVAVLAVSETVSWGVLYYAFAVFLPAMQRSLGWSKAELTGAFSVALATSAVAAFPVGRWLDRHSPRPLMTLGSVLGAFLVLAWSQVHGLLLFYLVWIGIGLAMACVLYDAAFTVVTKWFRARRRQALTAVTLMGGFASFIFSPLSNHLIDAQGWRSALVTLAVVLAATTVPLHGLFLRRAPEQTEPRAPVLVPGDPPAVFLLQGAGLAVLAATTSVPGVVAAVCLFGMGNGMARLVRATAIADPYGSAFYGSIAGVLAACATGARAVAPVIAAGSVLAALTVREANQQLAGSHLEA